MSSPFAGASRMGLLGRGMLGPVYYSTYAGEPAALKVFECDAAGELPMKAWVDQESIDAQKLTCACQKPVTERWMSLHHAGSLSWMLTSLAQGSEGKYLAAPQTLEHIRYRSRYSWYRGTGISTFSCQIKNYSPIPSSPSRDLLS